ncbi:UNVERIFIED_CONTAM: hypothetical protein GTU68_030883, partial [Idotea baltica]|nr:hypothetical protein [Idotea baltica]
HSALPSIPLTPYPLLRHPRALGVVRPKRRPRAGVWLPPEGAPRRRERHEAQHVDRQGLHGHQPPDGQRKPAQTRHSERKYRELHIPHHSNRTHPQRHLADSNWRAPDREGALRPEHRGRPRLGRLLQQPDGGAGVRHPPPERVRVQLRTQPHEVRPQAATRLRSTGVQGSEGQSARPYRYYYSLLHEPVCGNYDHCSRVHRLKRFLKIKKKCTKLLKPRSLVIFKVIKKVLRPKKC